MSRQQSFGDRLRRVLSEKRWTQGQLAQAIGVSQGAVSQWLSGLKAPPPRRMDEVARLLGVSASWLAFGGKEGAPAPELTSQREEYQRMLKWVFRPAPPDGGRDYGNANLWTVKWDINTLVRESGQNTNDVPLNRADGVEIEYRIIRLAGEDLERFLAALAWNGEGGLMRHLESAASSGQKLGSVLTRGLDRLRQEGEMLLLRVDDYRTTGLTGPEFGEGRFPALCRNNLHSEKGAPDGQAPARAGGSYGLGKAVFWLASEFATVLVNSNLSSAVTSDGVARLNTRIIGRSDLSWHRIDVEEYAGPGWLGEPKDTARGAFASSVWDNQALARDLFLDREGDGSGTSILVVGFRDAASDERLEMKDLSSAIEEATAKNFWPALSSGRMTVRVSTYDGRDRRTEVTVEPERYAVSKPFVTALDAYRRNELAEVLSKPGDVVSQSVNLRIPARKVAQPHREMEHDAVVLVSRCDDDAAFQLQDHIAYYRGFEMVVRYERLSTHGAVPFCALVLCGEATGDAEDDIAAEQFLRIAEPPEHNVWELTPVLRAEYALGGGKALREFSDGVKTAVREVVRPQADETDDGPRGLKELLKIGEETAVSPHPRLRVLSGELAASGSWVVKAEIRLPDARAWAVEPVLAFAAESGVGRRVDWTLAAEPPARIENGQVLAPRGARKLQFTGTSVLSSHPVDAQRCAVKVSIRTARAEEAE